MALTKVSGDFIKAGSVTQAHLHSSHGITTSHLTEGDKLFFTNARVDSRIGSLSSSDLSEGTNLYYTDARARAAISATGSLSYNSTTGVMSFTMPAQNTSNITEGSNLYYTDARADARIAAADTGDLSEGTNLYYTDARADARADARITASDTDSLSEGSTNLYYTDARADARVALIVDSAPGTLNTLNELAAALGDDASFSTTVTNSIATKMPLAGGTFSGGLTISDSILISYTGSDASSRDAGIKIINDSSDWGIIIDKGSATGNNYGVRINTDGGNGFSLYNSSGVNKINFTGAGNATFAGTLTASGYNDSNWNTAYGWGDHGSGGYLTSFDITTQTDGKYIRSDADDTASGIITLTKNTATGLSNSTFSHAKTIIGGIHFANGAGPAANNGNQAAITFQGGSASEAQAGIYVHNNNSEGTHMLFATTDSYAAGPKAGITLLNNGNVTIRGTVGASNFSGSSSGTNTGDQTLPTLASLGAAAAATTLAGYGITNAIEKGAQIASGASWNTATRFGSTGDLSQAAGNHALSVRSENNNDAFMSFHIGSDYAVHFGLDGATNRMHVGGWSDGTGTQHQLYDSRDFSVANVLNSNVTLATLGYTGATNANYITNNNQLTNGAAYLIASGTIDTSHASFLSDTRGSARLPNYYPRNRSSWDFQNSSDTGAGGDAWHGLMTVSKWSSWHSSHRVDQLVFTGAGHLKFRTSSSDTAWAGWRQIWDSSNLTNNNQLTNGAGYTTNTGTLTSAIGGTRLDFVSGAGGSTFGANNYSMGVDIANGAWSNPNYSDLIIGYHTGIRIGAAYGGTRFYANSPTTDTNNTGHGNGGEALIFTVGGAAGANDTKVEGIGYAVESFRAPIFYDTADTNSYFSSEALVLRSGDPSIYFRDTNHRSVVLHNNSNRLYVLGAPVDSTSYAQVNGVWPWYVQLDTNDVYTGRIGFAGDSYRAPVFYDSNDTGYYVDANSTSRLLNLDFGVSGYYLKAGDWGTRQQTPYGWIQLGPANTGHAHIYTDRSNFYFNAQLQVNGGSLINTNDIRAGVFYDVNNTGYYFDGAGNSHFSTISCAGGLLFGTDYGIGVTGKYASSRIQTVFNMGAAYKINSGGTSVSGAYGLYWSHQNAGSLGGANNLASHGILIIENGGFKGAWGGGRLVTPSDIRGTLFYDYNNTGYYVDPASITILNDFRCDIMYDKDNTGYYIRPASTSITNDFRATLFYARENTAYYTRPHTSSYINSLITAGSIQAGSSGTSNIYMGGTSGNHFRFHTHNGVSYFDMNSGTINWRQGSSTRYYFYPSTANMTINGTLTQYSDIRYKENIVEIPDAINKIKSIRGVYYNRTDFNTEPTKIGVIAQEVEVLMPELILQAEDTDMKSVSYNELTAVLVQAIKEQQTIIDDLKSRLETLENQ
jgi:hypothetical protein